MSDQVSVIVTRQKKSPTYHRSALIRGAEDARASRHRPNARCLEKFPRPRFSSLIHVNTRNVVLPSVLRNLAIVVDDPVPRCARPAPSPSPPSRPGEADVIIIIGRSSFAPTA